MERPSPAASATVMQAVEEIMRVFRSLPARPSVEEVEAAKAVIETANSEEESRIREIERIEKPADVPEELFAVLQEARKTRVLMQCREQQKEAAFVEATEKGFQVFDALIQRASELVSAIGAAAAAPGIGGSSSSLEEKDGKMGEADDSNRTLPSSSKSEIDSVNGGTSLSLIHVASLIELAAKKGTRVIDLQGKLMEKVEWLPTSLGKLQHVTELNLSDNRIMALPNSISSMKRLRKFDIRSNQLINLPDSFGELPDLIDLDLHANRLKSLPSTFGNLTSLGSLDLSSNQFCVLPDTLGNLTNLRRLNAETNELEELPHTIGSCTALVEMRLGFNRFKAVPEAIGKLECLEVLTLQFNRVKSLPLSMSSLSRLKELDASFNELESITDCLCSITSLVRLDVGRNFADLTALPGSIGKLEMLEELDISSNQIKVLPDSFRLLKKLRVFNADETPLEVPPREVAKLGARDVVQYMDDLASARMENDLQAKTKGFLFWLCSLCSTWQEE